MSKDRRDYSMFLDGINDYFHFLRVHGAGGILHSISTDLEYFRGLIESLKNINEDVILVTTRAAVVEKTDAFEPG